MARWHDGDTGATRSTLHASIAERLNRRILWGQCHYPGDMGDPLTPGRLHIRGRCAADNKLQTARRRTSQTVTPMSKTDSARSQPPSIHWNGQNRLAGW